MLDDLNELRTFERILALGSLSAAARDLGVGLAVVSKRLAALERRTGQRLVNRTTRSLSPTAEGLTLLPRIERMLEELDAAEALLASGSDEPSGMLRVSAPVSLGRIHLVPLAAELIARWPRLDIDLKLDDRLVDLVDERIDVAIRIGQPRDSTAVMRKLADNSRYLVASPSYLESRGRPSSVNELSGHVCLRYDDGVSPWRLVGPGGEIVDVATRTRLKANSGDAVHDWARAGCGIMLKSCADVAGELERGILERVLPGWQSEPAPIYALTLSGRHRATKVSAFLDAVAKHLQACTPAMHG